MSAKKNTTENPNKDRNEQRRARALASERGITYLAALEEIRKPQAEPDAAASTWRRFVDGTNIHAGKDFARMQADNVGSVESHAKKYEDHDTPSIDLCGEGHPAVVRAMEEFEDRSPDLGAHQDDSVKDAILWATARMTAKDMPAAVSFTRKWALALSAIEAGDIGALEDGELDQLREELTELLSDSPESISADTSVDGELRLALKVLSKQADALAQLSSEITLTNPNDDSPSAGQTLVFELIGPGQTYGAGHRRTNDTDEPLVVVSWSRLHRGSVREHPAGAMFCSFRLRNMDWAELARQGLWIDEPHVEAHPSTMDAVLGWLRDLGALDASEGPSVRAVVEKVAAARGYDFAASYVAKSTGLPLDDVQYELDGMVDDEDLNLFHEVLCPMSGRPLARYASGEALPIGETIEGDDGEQFIVTQRDIMDTYSPSAKLLAKCVFPERPASGVGGTRVEAAQSVMS